MRDWAGGKSGPQRTEYGRTSWYLTHRNPSEKSTGSFAIHAFPDILGRDIQKATGYRSPIECPEAAECSAFVETIEGRSVLRSQKAVRIPFKPSEARTRTLRLIGGHRAIQSLYGASEKESQLYLDRLIAEKGPDPVDIHFAWVDAPWNGHRVVRVSLGEDPIGFVPEDMPLDESILGKQSARLLTRGKSVFATILQ